MTEKFLHEHADKLYLVSRVVVGLLFFLHGAQKFGLLGGEAKPLMSLMGLAGVIELLAGVLLVLGLVTRVAALLSAVQMLVAYFYVHAPQGLNPLSNKGELALLYFAFFLVLLGWGAGQYSLDALLFHKKKHH